MSIYVRFDEPFNKRWFWERRCGCSKVGNQAKKTNLYSAPIASPMRPSSRSTASRFCSKKRMPTM